MLRRKSKKTGSFSQIRFIEVQLGGDVLFEGNIMGLPLNEEWILKKSIEFFDDPAPCYIHRSAVTVRLLDEIWESAESASGTTSEYIDFPPGAIVKKAVTI